MPGRGFRSFGKRAGPKLDRGRRLHGAKWVFVTGDDNLVDYRQMREQWTDDKAFKRWRDSHPDYLLFKSGKEAKRWIGLRALQRQGRIRALARQVRCKLLVTNPAGLKVEIGLYIADFTYEERDEISAGSPWVPIIEDTKGYKEDLYLWKKRHLEAQLGVILRES